KDERKLKFSGDPDKVKKRIWSIGGESGWYFWNWAWILRGFIDKLVGGVGLRRGRRSATELRPGDALDFWRVIMANYDLGRLILYAEMKLPGEAWLEFKVNDENKKLIQKATFRPYGLFGRLYWYILLPFHVIIFQGMAKKIIIK
ncbi:MAG: DUF2867 domain-containing protein, partial [Melioribacteraceae bacterium]|nr:DUF2867 domain-containing protein [Melioribacteraceae bacterium]